MRYEEITVKEALSLSPHKHVYINPYNGCSMGCPFCYWLSQPGWENRIQIKTNIAQILEQELRYWPQKEPVYLGSVCDPYNELEAGYGLTRKCLEVVKQYEIPLLITTSAARDTVLRDVDLLKDMKVILVAELARIPFLKQMKEGGEHIGIQYANQLRESGLKVYGTLAPIYPGVIEPEPVLERLNQEIPLYIDGLYCEPGSSASERVKTWIEEEGGQYRPQDTGTLEHPDSGYFKWYLERYRNDSRVRQFPFDLEFEGINN